MIELSFQDVLDATGARLLRGDALAPLSGISSDSRSIARGELFVALDGPKHEGNRYAVDALARGAGGLFLREGAAQPEPAQGAAARTPVALHKAPRRGLAELAAWHRGRLDIPVVGITGSCGKTTTKNMLVELVSEVREVIGSPASFNNDIGVPHTLLRAGRSTGILVVELGTNNPGEIAALCRVARPTAGIITNVGASHLAGLGSVDGVAREKGALAACLPPDGFLVVDADSRFASGFAASTAARVIRFSLEGEGDLNASDVWFEAGRTSFVLNGSRTVELPLLGLHNVKNLLAALCACVGLGIELERVLAAVPRLSNGKRRMERIQLGDLLVFDDTYNANPESAKASLAVLASAPARGRRVLILGDMLELGECSRELHHDLGRTAARAGVDLLVLVGRETRAAAEGALHEGHSARDVLHFPELEEALAVVPAMLGDGDLVLVKGSNRIGLDRLVERVRALRAC